MNIKKLSSSKLRAILAEIKMSSMGMKDIMLQIEIEDELLERGVL